MDINMIKKLECRDCGEPTWNRTERCGPCKNNWRRSLEEQVKCIKCKTTIGWMPGLHLCDKCTETAEEINIDCLCNTFRGNAEDTAATKAKCKCMGMEIVGPGLVTIPQALPEIKVINCKICKEDYGLFPATILVGSSVDCPFCAEGMPHVKHINGFKLPNVSEYEAMEEDDMGFYNCETCDEKIHTSQLPATTCNTCLSKEDDSDDIQYPKHYNAGKIQPIDAIEDWNLDFRLANAVKYIARHQHKGSAKKDLEKAVWYIERYIEKELTKDGK